MENDAIISDLRAEIDTFWINSELKSIEPRSEIRGKKFFLISAAQNRLMRFMPYLEKAFPETAGRRGIIESELIEIPAMKKWISDKKVSVSGRVFLKDDAHLAISGSVKARGGIYEVLKIAEELVVKNKLLHPTEDHSVLDSEEFKSFFSKYTIQTGSTGNLGLSVGVMGAKLGFKTIIHMSADAKQWKKDLLRSYGAEVREYQGNYVSAVGMGRELSAKDPMSFFIDDESSEDLFMGYATAALRLKVQLFKAKVNVDEKHPLFVYIPCGVGGAPGGITFGLKQLFGDAVHCFFVEPTQAPCMTLGMVSGKHSAISIEEIGLEGKTIADGLAVSRPSGYVCNIMQDIMSGCMTVSDDELSEYQAAIKETDNIYLEPSAAAGFKGLEVISGEKGRRYLESHGIADCMENATHIVWGTGGGLYEKLLIK